MEDKKLVYVNNKTYEKIAKELGYEPENLHFSRFLPEGQAFAINSEHVNTPFYKGYKPSFYLKK